MATQVNVAISPLMGIGTLLRSVSVTMPNLIIGLLAESKNNLLQTLKVAESSPSSPLSMTISAGPGCLGSSCGDFGQQMSTVDSTHGWVMFGRNGSHGNLLQKTMDGKSFERLPSLPSRPTKCLEALDNGGDIFALGRPRQAFIYRTSSSSWEQQPDLPSDDEGASGK